MKFLTESVGFILLASLAFTQADNSICYNSVKGNCSGSDDKSALSPSTCTAQFGQFPRLNEKTEALIRDHLRASMQFLVLANHFGEWNINRKGFFDYFHKLSDQAWEDAVALLQHMVKRGGALSSSFQVPAPEEVDETQGEYYDMTELHALSKALDIQKNLARTTLRLITLSNHGPAIKDTDGIDEWRTQGFQRDGEFAHFLADEVSDKHVVRIKHLANHVHSLSQALDSTSDAGLVIYLYDTQFLK